MKRLLLLLMLLLLLATALSAATGNLLLDAVVFGLDVATKAGKGKVEVTFPDEEEVISIRRVSLKKMRTTFEEHDFLVLDYEQRLEIYNRLSVPVAWPIAKNVIIGFGKGFEAAARYDWIHYRNRYGQRKHGRGRHRIDAYHLRCDSRRHPRR